MKMIYFFTYLIFSFKIDQYLIVFNIQICDMFTNLVFHTSDTIVNSI